MFNNNIILCLLNIISILLFTFCLFFFSNKNVFIKANNLGLLGVIFSYFYVLFFLKNWYLFFLYFFLIILSLFISILISNKIDIIYVPELISLMHSFVGLSAVIIGFNNLLLVYNNVYLNIIYLIEVFLSNFIGSITFIGSIVAFLKLRNFLNKKKIFKKKIIFLFNLFLLFFLFYLFLFYEFKKIFIYYIIFFSSCFLGFILVNNLDSSDVPIVLSLLNSYSGLSALFSGFILNNNLLIIIGSIVFSSGFFLTKNMCFSINKSILFIILGNFLVYKNKILNKSDNIKNNIKKISIKYVINFLKKSKKIIIVPGYGMALSKSHYLLYHLTNILVKNFNIDVKFAIHPVAGRLPGHMNVLLAESKISNKYIYFLDDINDLFSLTDLTLVIGANDIINCRAIYDKDCILYGMPVLKVWNSKYVVIFKKTDNLYTGYSNIKNPVFFKDNSYLLIGNAKYNLKNIIDLLI